MHTDLKQCFICGKDIPRVLGEKPYSYKIRKCCRADPDGPEGFTRYSKCSRELMRREGAKHAEQRKLAYKPPKIFCEACKKQIFWEHGDTRWEFENRRTCRGDIIEKGKRAVSKCAKRLAVIERHQTIDQKKQARENGRKGGYASHTKKQLERNAKRNKDTYNGVYKDLPKPAPRRITPQDIEEQKYQAQLEIDRKEGERLTARVSRPLQESYQRDPQFNWLFA